MNNDDLYMNTPIDDLIKWVDKYAIKYDDYEAGDLSCEAYEEYLELRDTNAELVDALELIASRVEEPRDDDEGIAYIPFHKETLAPMYEAIRKAKEK